MALRAHRLPVIARRRGQLGKHVLIVLQGRVVVTRGLFTSHVEQTFETGSVFGELEYLQSFYLDGFSYARQRNHFSAVLKECTYKLAGTCFENCPSKCHGRKVRRASGRLRVGAERTAR